MRALGSLEKLYNYDCLYCKLDTKYVFANALYSRAVHMGAMTQVFALTRWLRLCSTRKFYAKVFKARCSEKCWKSSLFSGNFVYPLRSNQYHSEISINIFSHVFSGKFLLSFVNEYELPFQRPNDKCSVIFDKKSTFCKCFRMLQHFRIDLRHHWLLITVFKRKQIPVLRGLNKIGDIQALFSAGALSACLCYLQYLVLIGLHIFTHFITHHSLLFTLHDYWYWGSIPTFYQQCQLNHNIYSSACSFVGGTVGR